MSSDDPMEAIVAARFAPFRFVDISSFPNTLPAIDVWGDGLPRFREKDEDNPAHNVIKFINIWIN